MARGGGSAGGKLGRVDGEGMGEERGALCVGIEGGAGGARARARASMWRRCGGASEKRQGLVLVVLAAAESTKSGGGGIKCKV